MSVHAGPDIVESGLVLHLDAGNTRSYPGSGTTWTDLSANGITGTLTNGPTFSSANGGSIVFDGTDDYVNMGDIALLNNTLNGATNWTICHWCNATSTAVNFGRILDRGNLGTDLTGSMEFDVANIGRNNTNGGTSSVDVVVGNVGWKFICFTRTSGLLGTWYVDGKQRNSTQMTESYDGAGIWKIGRRAFNTVSNFQGNIVQIAIYNRVLSASEIQQNFNALRGRFGI